MMADDEKMSSGDDEDALKSICKSGMKADFIAARNQKDFSSSEVMAIRPDESNESERRNTDLGPFGRGGPEPRPKDMEKHFPLQEPATYLQFSHLTFPLRNTPVHPPFRRVFFASPLLRRQGCLSCLAPDHPSDSNSFCWPECHGTEMKSLSIRTGDELENLSGTMAEMEKELVRHEDQIEALLDSLVKSLSTAIDDRSHYTGKHTRNMVRMAEAYLDWMEAHGNPWKYDEMRRRVFIMSVGLHDIGKLSVPLYIMDKSTRLGAELRLIEERFTKIRLLNRIAMLEGRISGEECRQKEEEEEKDLALIRRINTATTLSDEDLAQVRGLASRTFTDEDGTTRYVLSDAEVTMLSIRRGTLTAEERTRMQGHATSTWNILNQVDFPEQYAQVPMWASSHHELLQGNGYPNGLAGKEIPREVRLLTILDIFEALTAKDRPYKPSFSLEKSWKILDSMVQDGSLDGELLASFRESRAWEAVLSSDGKPVQEKS